MKRESDARADTLEADTLEADTLEADTLELGPCRPGDEEQVVPLLIAGHPHSWGRSRPGLWTWKHPDRPGARAGDVLLARSGERVVGCFHSAVLPLKLAPGVMVSAGYDGDYAVYPEMRGRSLTARAYAQTDPELAHEGISLRGGFTSRELNERHYGKKFGYVFVRTATGQFRKMIGLDPLRARVESLGRSVLARPRVRRALRRHPVTVRLDIDGLPVALLRCRADGFTLKPAADGGGSTGASAASHEDADVSLRLPYRALAALPERPGLFLLRLAGGLVLRRAGVRGLMKGMLRLLQIGAAALVPEPRPIQR